jgi:hypothetical protein
MRLSMRANSWTFAGEVFSGGRFGAVRGIYPELKRLENENDK